MITDYKEAILIARKARAKQSLVRVSGINSAKILAGDLAFYFHYLKVQDELGKENIEKKDKSKDIVADTDTEILVMPEGESDIFRYEAKSRTQDALRLAAYSALANKENVCVVAPSSTFDETIPALDIFLRDSCYIETGLTVDREVLIERLINLGYERMPSCEAFGEFSARGDIIDVFGPGMENPVRIELFDDEVDSIRSYNIFSQRSIENLNSIRINLTKMPDEITKPGKLTDYLQEGALYIDDEETIVDTVLKPAPVYAGHMDVLEKDLKNFSKNGYRIVIVCSSQDRIDNLNDFIERSGIKNVHMYSGIISGGVELPEEKLVFISENDIFASRKRVRKTNHKSSPIKAFTDINVGDYVVHELHGIGQFTGVVRLTVDGSSRDYLKIQYAGADVLYVPVDQMDNIQKYMGSESGTPRISKLSGNEWQQVKARAKESIIEMAEEYLKNAAKRAAAPGYAYPPDSSWQREFEDAFPYTETDDQLRASAEIKGDMEKSKAMDRLLCGDVGYGKTEVACRAIFKALESGKQVAVLAPTTILVNQHYHSFLNRFKGYPFAIDMLCRFKDTSEQKKIVEKLKKGDVDLVVGTHRLLGSDVKFKDLGLLVIDEEQRFGVEHKETIKRLKEGVDVLALSATPIPRTLHMSLIGVRDMSVLEQPPEDRYPVQTYVMEQEDEPLKSAIIRELARNGQVFIVYNRVSGIQGVARHINELVPEAKIAVGHGQMNERELEDVMYKFNNGETDILIATTIIESGLDIPNVNTLIVLNADFFGLSQLYQLRGRVGRSNRMAYAYLFVKKDKQLSDVAEKRLRAIKEFTEFGSGFRVAMRDLELRGAGNILGREQSGHMINIGYEMYCKLVEEAVRELKAQNIGADVGEGAGDTATENLDTQTWYNADTSVELGISAFIPEKYVSDELLRLDLYKRISSIATKDDQDEMLDEMLDRFGDLPSEAANLLDIAYIRNMASKCGINKVLRQQNKLVLIFDELNILKPEIFGRLMDSYGPALTIYGGTETRISLALRPNESFRKKSIEILGKIIE